MIKPITSTTKAVSTKFSLQYAINIIVRTQECSLYIATFAKFLNIEVHHNTLKRQKFIYYHFPVFESTLKFVSPA